MCMSCDQKCECGHARVGHGRWKINHYNTDGPCNWCSCWRFVAPELVDAT